MYNFFGENIDWFILGWYIIASIFATIIASYKIYQNDEDPQDTIGPIFFLVLFSPLIIPIVGMILVFSPLLIPWFLTRKIILDKKKKKQRIENIKR